MSPSAFKLQVTQLLAELAKCLELCDAVRTNRRLGTTHEALDRLQSGLEQSAHDIQIQFTTLRKTIGSRMDLGDEAARHYLNRAIREVQSDIQTRLGDIAFRRRDRNSHDPELPGFRDLRKKVERIEDEVSETLENVAQRLEDSKAEISRPTPQNPASKLQPKSDEVVTSLKELEHLLAHFKNSWMEYSVEGRAYYVNCLDEKMTQWEKPDGFIKTALAQPVRTPKERQPRRPTVEDSWDNSDGW